MDGRDTGGTIRDWKAPGADAGAAVEDLTGGTL